MAKLRYTARFKRDYRRGVEKGCSPEKLRALLELLRLDGPLPLRRTVGGGGGLDERPVPEDVPLRKVGRIAAIDRNALGNLDIAAIQQAEIVAFRHADHIAVLRHVDGFLDVLERTRLRPLIAVGARAFAHIPVGGLRRKHQQQGRDGQECQFQLLHFQWII